MDNGDRYAEDDSVHCPHLTGCCRYCGEMGMNWNAMFDPDPTKCCVHMEVEEEEGGD